MKLNLYKKPSSQYCDAIYQNPVHHQYNKQAQVIGPDRPPSIHNFIDTDVGGFFVCFRGEGGWKELHWNTSHWKPFLFAYWEKNKLQKTNEKLELLITVVGNGWNKVELVVHLDLARRGPDSSTLPQWELRRLTVSHHTLQRASA